MAEVVLRAAERARTTSGDLAALREERNGYWRYFVDKSYANDSLQIIAAVGFAAVQALTVVLEDERFDERSLDDTRTDQDIDADQLDAAFFAASASAGGPVWVAESDATRRQAFWLWWLEEVGHIAAEQPAELLS